MPGSKTPGPCVKDDKTYEALRDEGASQGEGGPHRQRQGGRHRTCSRKGGKSGSYEDWTVDDLRDRAAEIGIEGRSDMSKDELIDALRNH